MVLSKILIYLTNCKSLKITLKIDILILEDFTIKRV